MNKILQAIRKEINSTLFFFVQGDLEIYGFITADTVKAFETQKVKMPSTLKEFIK